MKKVKKSIKKKTSKNEITKKTLVSELLAKNPNAAEILFKEGLFCLGCPMATQENLDQACQSHGLDVEKVLKKLNKRR